MINSPRKKKSFVKKKIMGDKNNLGNVALIQSFISNIFIIQLCSLTPRKVW